MLCIGIPVLFPLSVGEIQRECWRRDSGSGARREVRSEILKKDFCGSGEWALEC